MDEQTPIAQQYICDLAPYQPGLPIMQVARQYKLDPKTIIKLASNENPLGMGAKAHAALLQALPQAHRYPEQDALLQALSRHWHVPSNQIVLGNGSNDVLDLVARTFLGQGDEAVSSQYAFAVYAIATQSVGAKNVVVPATHYTHDLPAMVQAITPRTKVLWIANPNNPTGTFVPYDVLHEYLLRIPKRVTIVLDEAYYEYLDKTDRYDSTQWLNHFSNLILVRTFSKIHGLAGLRIGYGMASPHIAEHLNRVRHPFNANVLATAAAVAALVDKPFARHSATANRAGRRLLLRGLERLGLTLLPAFGNFVTFAVPGAVAIAEGLLRQGVIVRPLTSYGMPDHLRVTVGTIEENQRFLTVLGTLLTDKSR